MKQDVELTATDRKILSLIDRNKNIPFEDLVKETKLSYEKVKRAIDNLTKVGLVGEYITDRYTLDDFKGKTHTQTQNNLFLKLLNKINNIEATVWHVRKQLQVQRKP